MIAVVLGVVAVVIVAAVAALVTGRIGYDPMAPATTSTPDTMLPRGEVTAADIAGIRFDTTLRGYRMDQVDDVLDRLQTRLAELEAEVGSGANSAD